LGIRWGKKEEVKKRLPRLGDPGIPPYKKINQTKSIIKAESF
jgi:hypothetical protein